MSLSLEDGIEIHARALFYRRGVNGIGLARERAVRLQTVGDDEGFSVWQSVAELIEQLAQKSLPLEKRAKSS